MTGIHYDKFSEFVFSIVSMIWGICLLLPFPTYFNSPEYWISQTAVNESIFGATMFLVGGVWFWALLTKNRYNIRKILILISLFLWTTIVLASMMWYCSFSSLLSSITILVLLTKLYSDIIVQLLGIKYGN